MPAGPMTETRRARRSRLVAWNRSLSRRSSSSRPTNGASSVSARFRPPTLGDDAERPPGGDRGGLALEGLLAGRLEGDRARSRPAGSPRRRGPSRAAATDCRRDAVLTRSPATIPWFVAPSVTAASPVRTPARAWIDGPERPDRVDELEACADGPLGVVLVGGRRAPDGHDRVADELLDRPAVAADDVAGEVEVAGEQLAGVLGVAALGERREADEVGEEDRDEAALGDRARRRRGRSCAGRSQPAGCVMAPGSTLRAARRTRRRTARRARSAR